MTTNLRVLLVDDEYDISSILKMVLEMENFVVVTAYNGQAALNALATAPLPDLVITDAMMPVMNGYEFIDAVRADPDLAKLPIMLISAAQPDPARLAGKAWDVYLQKPFDLQRFVNEARRLSGEGKSH